MLKLRLETGQTILNRVDIKITKFYFCWDLKGRRMGIAGNSSVLTYFLL